MNDETKTTLLFLFNDDDWRKETEKLTIDIQTMNIDKDYDFKILLLEHELKMRCLQHFHYSFPKFERILFSPVIEKIDFFRIAHLALHEFPLSDDSIAELSPKEE